MSSDGLPSDSLPASGAPEDDVDRAANAAALAAGLRVSRRSELRRMCEGLERKLSAAVGDIALMAEALEASQQKVRLSKVDIAFYSVLFFFKKDKEYVQARC